MARSRAERRALPGGGALPDPGDRTLRIALCQYDSRPVAYEWNVRHAFRYAEEAAANGADVIVLPEYSFCTADDVLNGDAFFRFRKGKARLCDALSDFADEHDCHLVVNVPVEFKDEGDEDVLHRRNRSVVFGPDGSVVATYDKRGLAILDTCSAIEPGPRVGPVDLPFGRVGMMICRDSTVPESFPLYRDADLLLVQFAHITAWDETSEPPVWLMNDIGNSLDDFPKIAAACARELGLPLVMVNKTGMEPEGAYTGGSCAVGSDGRLVARADCGGDILYVDFPLDESGRLFGANPSEPAETLRD